MEPEFSTLPGDDDDLVLSAVSRVRLIQFTKDTEEPMGITLKVDLGFLFFILFLDHGRWPMLCGPYYAWRINS